MECHRAERREPRRQGDGARRISAPNLGRSATTVTAWRKRTLGQRAFRATLLPGASRMSLPSLGPRAIVTLLFPGKQRKRTASGTLSIRNIHKARMT